MPDLPVGGGGKKALILVAIVLVLFLVGMGLVIRLLMGRLGSGNVTLTYWGLWEDNGIFNEVLADYKKQKPNVEIKYTKQSPIQYRERLLSAMGKEDGPDLVRIHNTWIPMFASVLSPVPAESYSAAKFKTTFYPVAAGDTFIGGKPYAIPLEIDTLGLYVNEDLLSAAGVTTPTTWDEFREAAKKLTVRDDRGRIRTSGAALGTTANIDHWQDILSLMMLQAGVDIRSEANSLAAQEVLLYFTTFITVDKVWDETLDGSTLAFASGKTAMYFGPSWRYFDIKNLNQNLKFRVVPVPQLTGSKTTNYASYWVEGVAKNSKNAKEAHAFLKFMSEAATLEKLYAAQAKTREFGEPYPRQEMAAKLLSDQNVGPFIAAAPAAQSSYLASATRDGESGINSRISKYYIDAINGALRGQNAKGLLDTVDQGIKQVLGDYGIK